MSTTRNPHPLPGGFQFRSGAVSLGMHERESFGRLPETERQRLLATHPTNQDYYISRPTKGIHCVADGMGGHQGGEIASQTVGDAFVGYFDYVSPLELTADEAIETVHAAVEKADKKLRFEKARLGLGRAGTTLSALLFIEQGNKAVLFNAGDSVIYHIRAGALCVRTTAQCTPQSNKLTNCFTGDGRRDEETTTMLVQAMATDAELAPVASKDLITDQVIIADVQSEDRFILATDGLVGGRPFETIRDTTICLEALRHNDPQHAAEALSTLPERLNPSSYLVAWTDNAYVPYRPKIDDLSVVAVDPF